MSCADFRGFHAIDQDRKLIEFKKAMSAKRKHSVMAQDRRFVLQDRSTLQTSDNQENTMEIVNSTGQEVKGNELVNPPIKGASRGLLLWRTFQSIRKSITKVSEPLSKSQKRSLRRQLSFQVDDLERIVLGVKPSEPENVDDADDFSDDDEMREEVSALVNEVLDGAAKKGKVVKADYFEKRMKLMQDECTSLRKRLDDIQTKRSRETSKGATTAQYIPIHTTEVPNREPILETPTPCTVCGTVAPLIGGWRCVSCKNFWSRLLRKHQQGKMLPNCDHLEPFADCKGCRRRMYEKKHQAFTPGKNLGVPPCPPPSAKQTRSEFFEPVEMREESRELKLEYW